MSKTETDASSLIKLVLHDVGFPGLYEGRPSEPELRVQARDALSAFEKIERDLAAANAKLDQRGMMLEDSCATVANLTIKLERYRVALADAELTLKVVYAHVSPALQPGIYGQIKDAIAVVHQTLEQK